MEQTLAERPMHILNSASAPKSPARYAVIRDPMHELCAADMREVPEGATFADLVEPGSTWLCQVAGQDMGEGDYLPRSYWDTLPMPGDVIVFHRRAMGGDNGRSVLQIAVALAAAWVTGGAGGALTAGSFGANAAGLAVAIGGNALINAVVPLDQTNMTGVEQPASPTYSVNVQGNQSRIGQPIPVLYGHNLTYPDYPPDCDPYQLFEDNEQFLYVTLCVGMGAMDILRISIEDTPVDDLQDVDYVIVGPGQADGETLADQSLVKQTIVNNIEAANQELLPLKIVRFVVVPRGRQAIALGVDIALPRGLTASLSVTWRVQALLINEYEQPLGAWETLADETYSTASAIPVRLSYSYSVAAGRYKLRIYRTDIRSTDPNTAHDMALIGLTCETETAGFDTTIPATFICLKIKASQQLNAISQRRIRVLSNRMLPVWDGFAWSAPVVTRSIAWAAADILRNTVYGRGLDDDQIDVATLLAIDAIWTANFDYYDGVFDTLSDTWSAIAQVLRVGRAVPLIRGSRYTAVRDGEDLEPVALYGMRNIRKGSFSLELGVPERDRITAMDIEYWDQTRWEWVTRTVQYEAGEDPPFISFEGDPPSPYAKSENVANLRLPGVIGPYHCSRWGAYTLANLLFRRSHATYRTHLDGLLPAYCAPVAVAHDVPSWGQSGDVVDWDGSTVTTSEPLDWSVGGTYYMRLHTADGVEDHVVTAGAEPNEALVTTPAGFDPSFDSANKTRTKYAFGPSTNMGALCRVRSITPRGERDIEHRVVLEDARVHTADEPFRIADDPISDGSSAPAEDSDVLVVRLLDRAITGSTLSGIGDTVADIVATHTLQDNGTADYSFIGSTLSGGATLPNEWLQGGMVPNATAALYEVRDTIISSTDPAFGTATLTGAIGSWQSLGSPRTLELRWVGPGGANFAQREILREIRDAATDTVQDTAVITLRCEYPETPGGE